jgi:hypothetical protein
MAKPSISRICKLCTTHQHKTYTASIFHYYEEEDDSTEIYADFVHRSLVTKMVDGTQPISQGCKRWAFLVPLHVLSAYGYQNL